MRTPNFSVLIKKFFTIIPFPMFKMRPIALLFTAAFLFIASTVFGQITTNFSIDPSTPAPFPVGNKVFVRMNVSGFTNIESIQMPVVYDKNVLRFDSLDLPDMPGFTDTTAASHPVAGRVILTWFPSVSAFPSGYTLSNNSRLVTLCFTVLANGVSQVNLSNSVPFQPIEVKIKNGGFATVNFQNGGVSITGGDGVPPAPTYTGFKIIANQIYIQQGQRGCMPVTVNDFDNMLTTQYAMHWNPAVLQFDCNRAYNLPQLQDKIANPNNSTQVIAWEDPAAAGVNRADGAKIYEICFVAIGQPGQSSLITIDGIGLPPTAGSAEAYNAASQNVWAASGANGPTPIPDTIYILPASPTPGMVRYNAGKDTIQNPTTPSACVPISVDNFTTMTGVEFNLTYDNTKLTLQTPIATGGPLSTIASNFVTTTAGQIRFNWSNTNGISVPNGTTIFSPCFTSTQPSGTVVPIGFTTATCVGNTPTAGTGAFKKNVGGVPFAVTAGEVRIENSAFSVTTTPQGQICPGSNTGVVNTTVQNGTPQSYLWNTGATSATLSNVGVGTYTVTVTSTMGQTATSSTSVNGTTGINLPVAGVTQPTCFGLSNGSITTAASGGSGALTYQWSNNATTANLSNIGQGVYTITVRDAQNCSSTQTVNVPGPQAVTLPTGNITVNPVNCFGTNTGSITVTPMGGMPGYNYLWNNNANTATINNLGANTSYTVTISDSKGCTTVSTLITVPGPASALNATFGTKTNVGCQGSSTGSIAISATGGTPGYVYTWRNMANNNIVSTAQNPTGLPAGTYNLTITDTKGCTTTLNNNVTIDGPASALALNTPTTTGADCFGQNTGSIQLNFAGTGWGNPQVTWSPSIPGGANPVNIPPGNYSASITDAGGCTITQAVTVAGPAADIAYDNQPSVSNLTCSNSGDGGIVISLTGGNVVIALLGTVA
jgi:hypothetical protein